jgi:hypothetical protein
MTYRKINSDEVVKTLDILRNRISERFPGSSLSAICAEIHTVAIEVSHSAHTIHRPSFWIRGFELFIALLFLLIIAILLHFFQLLDPQRLILGGEIIQNLDAITNLILLIGAAIYFFFTLETKVKRKRVLKRLFEIRSIAHVIDMHQLTKDPSRDKMMNTISSPDVRLSPFQLIRYLDYCSEMLSLLSKVAAIYGDASNDDVVLSTIDEIESLTTGLSTQIWQKITIIQAEMPR